MSDALVLIFLILLCLPVVILCGACFIVAFNGRFTSWREGRRTWREMARFRRRHA